MKNKILELRESGKSYNEICQILGCSKGTVSYHCGKGQKNKKINRDRKRRSDIVILNKVERFQNQNRNKLKDKSEDFQRERLGIRRGKRNITFNWRDVINKFGWVTTCYLTGREINLRNSKTYHFDHIIPISKGGDSTIDNLGICCCNANQAKHDMFIDEFLILCKEILEYHGFSVKNEQI